MSELACVRIRLNEGALPLVEAWARELDARRDEVLETLRLEGVTLEAAFLDESGADGPHLVYLMRAESLARAQEVGAGLTLPIQRYHREFKARAWGARTPLRLLVAFERAPS